jgi:Fe2+ transport system protein FeoA
MKTAVPLSSLIAGQSARICKVLGQPDHVHRLEEFGLRDGTKIQMFRQGNPCIIRLGGNKVCIRSDDLLSVLVEPTKVVC